MIRYTEEQKEQIKLGLDGDLDILLYMNPEYTAEQMRKIRLGLKENLDVSLYANPKIDANEMENIRTRLKFGLDIVNYDNLTLEETYRQSYNDLDRLIKIVVEQREKVDELKRIKSGKPCESMDLLGQIEFSVGYPLILIQKLGGIV